MLLLFKAQWNISCCVQVIPLPFITLAFWWLCQGLFKKPLDILSLRGAADLDRKDEVSIATSLSTGVEFSTYTAFMLRITAGPAR